MRSQQKQPQLGAVARPLTFERGRGVYAVETTAGLAHVVVQVGDDGRRVERLQRVLRALADAQIPIFLIKLHPESISFALESDLVTRAEDCLHGLAGECGARGDLSLVTITATSMRDLNDVMVTIAESLQQAGARLYGIGDSHNTVQCLVETAWAAAAVTELTAAFGLEAQG
jgi:aspartokinase